MVRPRLPPYANALAIPIAPSASSRSASCTHFPSTVSGVTESLPLNDTSPMILHIVFILSSDTPCALKKPAALSCFAQVSGDNFTSSTSCSSAASRTMLKSACSCSASFTAILYTLSE